MLALVLFTPDVLPDVSLEGFVSAREVKPGFFHLLYVNLPYLPWSHICTTDPGGTGNMCNNNVKDCLLLNGSWCEDILNYIWIKFKGFWSRMMWAVFQTDRAAWHRLGLESVRYQADFQENIHHKQRLPQLEVTFWPPADLHIISLVTESRRKGAREQIRDSTQSLSWLTFLNSAPS